MISLKLCRTILFRSFIAVVIISSLLIPPGFCQETEDSQIFVSGFNAYQQKDYAAAIEKLNEVLTKYPDTSLRDMALFWLARSYFKNGNQRDAARTMSRFTKEYPDNPLKNTVEDDILALVARYEKGEALPTGIPVKVAAEEAARKAKAEQDRITAARKEQERVAAEKAKAEQQRLAAAKAELKPQEKVVPEKAVTAKAEQPVADAKAEQDRKAAELAAKERLAAAKAEQERLAARKAELERQAQEKDKAAKAEQQRVADAKAGQERIAAARKAEEERLKAEAARLKQQQERVAAEKAAAAAEAARIAAARKEQERVATARMEKLRQLKQREAEEKARAEKVVLREKAIAQYKSIIENYPDSTAADTAVARLKELGITVAVQPKRVEPEAQVENDQVLKLQVAQFAGFEFSLKAHPQAYDVARRISVPFEITNRGNGTLMRRATS